MNIIKTPRMYSILKITIMKRKRNGIRISVFGKLAAAADKFPPVSRSDNEQYDTVILTSIRPRRCNECPLTRLWHHGVRSFHVLHVCLRFFLLFFCFVFALYFLHKLVSWRARWSRAYSSDTEQLDNNGDEWDPVVMKSWGIFSIR